jgi:hypothetical protein
MITNIKIDLNNMNMQYSISNQIDMDVYDKIIVMLKKSRSDFLVKIVQNEVEQLVKKCYIK